MLTWTSQLPESGFSPHALRWLDDDSLLFDIETTGLSPKNSAVYCIGCCHRNSGNIRVLQFFSQNPADEAEVLKAFLALTDGFRRLISFNGIRFDQPFIEKRCALLQLDCGLSGMEHLDIFQKCRPLKKTLALPSCKQKSIETFLGIAREDAYDGGRLIAVYQDYVRRPSTHALQLLKLHNYEDVTGMIHLLSMLAYPALQKNPILVSDVQIHTYAAADVQKTDGTDKPNTDGADEPNTDGTDEPNADGELRRELLLTGALPAFVPVPLRFHPENGYVILEQDRARCAVPLVPGPMKYFLPDYRNYDYLPEEQMVVHKSVASYMPSSRRQPATPKNCYLEKQGLFLPLPKELPCAGELKRFRKDYGSADSYLLYDDTWDNCFWSQYLTQLVRQSMT